MTEAKISFNCFLDHKDGYGGQITVRGDECPEWELRLVTVFAILEGMGYTRSIRKANGAVGNVAPAPSLTGEKVIEVTNIKLASGGKHPRWVVQGGNFTTHGITCWPEVLEEAGLLDKMKLDDDNKPADTWLAYYTEKLNEAGDKSVPDKVTKLERQA